jgi:hypothetical protein
VNRFRNGTLGGCHGNDARQLAAASIENCDLGEGMQLTATKSPTAAEERDRALAYVLVRLAIGASLFGHGLVRLPKLSAFHAGLVGEFKTSILPEILVSPCGYALPFAEFAIGALLLVGALTRAAPPSASRK